jgi:hypothetical protein
MLCLKAVVFMCWEVGSHVLSLYQALGNGTTLQSTQ